MKRTILGMTLAFGCLVSFGCGEGSESRTDNAVPDAGVESVVEAPPPLPPSRVSGWAEFEGARSAFSEILAFRYHDCPGELGTSVLLTSRPVDPTSLGGPLEPGGAQERLEILTEEGGEAVAELRIDGAGVAHLYVQRIVPGSRQMFHGPPLLSEQGPELTRSDDVWIEGLWAESDTTGWFGAGATFDLEFAAPVLDVLLAGDELPADGGEPGAIVRTYLAAVSEGDIDTARGVAGNLISWPEPGASPEEVERALSHVRMSAPSEWELVGGHVLGDRARVGWRGEGSFGSGFFYLVRGESGWVIEHARPCVRL